LIHLRFPAAGLSSIHPYSTAKEISPGWQIEDRLAVVATLIYAGLRVHELAALRCGDLDFVTSTIHVRHSETPAGIPGGQDAAGAAGPTPPS